MSETQAKLDEIRAEIDAIDDQLLALISQRAECAHQVGEIKQADSPDEPPVFYRPEREAQILRRMQAQNTGRLSNDAIAMLFREIVSACLALEQPLTIAYLGPEGTFSQAAANKAFGKSVFDQAVSNISDIFHAVETGKANYGVVPMENSTHGVIAHTLDMFFNSPLKICGEVELKISQTLMSQTIDLSKITEVTGHQQSLAQCRGWLDKYLSHARQVPVSSNAEGARMAVDNPQIAALGAIEAADIYDLNVLAESIEDEPNNTTRFIVIGTDEPLPSGNDKTSLMLSLHNEAGQLQSLLESFSSRGISMTRIESRPTKQRNWEYVFFIDIQGHELDENIKAALEEIEQKTSLLTVLGAYPRAAY